MSTSYPVRDLRTIVYRFPTPEPGAEGPPEWTTAVAVTMEAAGHTGLGWTYSSSAAASVVQHLVDVVRGRDVLDVPGGWSAIRRAARDLGTEDLVLQAISAVDIAWWDLKARLLGVPLTDLFGRCRDRVPIYGSGGLSTMTDQQLKQQIEGWRRAGCTAMKIEIGQSRGGRPEPDLERVRRLRDLAGAGVDLMVDANGGYTLERAIEIGAELDELGVTWFEEPVSGRDIEGLTTVRNALRCDVAAGEYAGDEAEVSALLPAVNCLQLDVTRCGGYTGWLRWAALARAHGLEVSGHCAPALHVPVAAAVPNLRHVEWFTDHARLAPLFVAGVPAARNGTLEPTTERSGHGMTLSRGAGRWASSGHPVRSGPVSARDQSVHPRDQRSAAAGSPPAAANS